MSKGIWAGSLAMALLSAQAQQPAGLETAQAIPDAPSAQVNVAQQGIPDAPRPQTTLPTRGSIAPGIGTTSTSGGEDAAEAPAAPPAADTVDAQPAVPTQSRDAFSKAPETSPDTGSGNAPVDTGQGVTTIRIQTNFVDVPFTVKDNKGNLIPGLTARDVRVYENGLLQHITNFTVDPFPLSVALVIDQSVSQDTMDRVNTALGALQGAFAPYDELAVFTYNNGPRMVTDFTASQSARLTQALERSKASGRQPLLAGSLGGPLAQTTVINDQQFDPNTAANRGHTTMQMNPPRDVHTLNDAILEAAKALTKVKERDRRRIIYVISDGREYGSQAKRGDVIRYLQANKIAVWGTLVGDSSLPVLGFLDRIHLPMMMRDNALPAYSNATGGNLDAEFRTGTIERSFAKIAEEARTQYTLGYYTHEPFIDGKYRKLEVRVLRPNLQVIAKQGYYPAATDTMRPPVVERVAQ